MKNKFQARISNLSRKVEQAEALGKRSSVAFIGVDPSPNNTTVAWYSTAGEKYRAIKLYSPADVRLVFNGKLVEAQADFGFGLAHVDEIRSDLVLKIALVERLSIRGGSFGIAYSSATSVIDNLKQFCDSVNTCTPQEWQKVMLKGAGVDGEFFPREASRSNPTKSKSIWRAKMSFGLDVSDPDMADALNIAFYLRGNRVEGAFPNIAKLRLAKILTRGEA